METFIASILKALPDAVLNAFVTIILSGLFLFVFQEKIKSSFAKSLYQYQIKYSKGYEKRIETLETLYHKFVEFRNDFNSMLTDTCNSWEYSSEPLAIGEDGTLDKALKKHF